LCSAILGALSILKMHINTVHENLRFFEYKIFLSEFELKRGPNGHRKTEHKNIKPFKCLTVCCNIWTTRPSSQAF
jgi:hypothetical protein